MTMKFMITKMVMVEYMVILLVLENFFEKLGNLCHLKQPFLLLCVVVVAVMVVVGEDLDHQHATKPNHHSQLDRILG